MAPVKLCKTKGKVADLEEKVARDMTMNEPVLVIQDGLHMVYQMINSHPFFLIQEI
jgi:hypothetical protein